MSPASLGSTPTSYLGEPIVAGEPFFEGSLSNVAFYTKALSAERIKEHYASAEHPYNTVAPSITGTPRDQSTMTAKGGTWVGLSPIALGYEWFRCSATGGECTAVTASASKYTAASADVDSKLKVIVTRENSFGREAVSSLLSATIEALAPSSTVLPAISGAAQEGVELKVSQGTWNGTPPFEYSCQWRSCI